MGVDGAEERWVTVDGRQVAYRRVGRGPTVVLSSPTWWPMEAWLLSGFPQLADRFDVLAFNHRGIGRSDPSPEPYTVQTLASDLVDLLAALGAEQADVVGFAIGGIVALEAALRAPGRIRRLVIAAAGAGEPGEPARSEGPPPVEQDYAAFIRRHALGPHAFGEQTRAVNPEVPQRLADTLVAFGGPEAEYRKHAHARQGYAALEAARRVQQPCLVLAGSEDFAARGASTPVAAAHALAGRLPRGELALVEGAQHMVFWDRPLAAWARAPARLEVLPRPS